MKTMTNAEYHAEEGVSRSAVMYLKKSPLDYWQKYLCGSDKIFKSTPAMTLGSLVHTLTLEPERFDAEYVVSEKVDCRTSEGKRYKKLLELKAKDEFGFLKMIINEEILRMAGDISASITNNPQADIIISNSLKEKSFFWTDEETGILCKARPDILNLDLSILCDLKTTNDNSYSKFIYEVIPRGYHIQAAMQIDALKACVNKEIESFCFIVAQTVEPYDPYIYYMPDDMIERGRHEYKSALRVLKKCSETNDWRADRKNVIMLNFSDYQLSSNGFHNLEEIYDVA